MRNVHEWLAEYGETHQHPVNKALHWVCVPLIVLAMLGFLWATPFPATALAPRAQLNWATVAILAGVVYYAFLSLPLALGLVPMLALAILALRWLDSRAMPLWQICLAVFIFAGIGQFIGHAIERRRPSFLKDLRYLLIGPLWLLSDLYRRLGLRY